MNMNTFMDTNTDEDKDKDKDEDKDEDKVDDKDNDEDNFKDEDDDKDNLYGLGREKVFIQIKEDSYKLWQRGACMLFLPVIGLVFIASLNISAYSIEKLSFG
jgi:hypothetical protein